MGIEPHLRRLIGSAFLVGMISFSWPFVHVTRGQGATSQGLNGDHMAYPKALAGEFAPGAVGTRPAGRDAAAQLLLNRMPGLSPDYRLGAGDTIEFTVIGQGTLQREINGGGNISVPFVGEVKVAELTAEEAENAIASALRDHQMLRDPQVLVSVTGYESKKVYVLGEMDRYGEYAMSSQLTLMDLIFFSGGIDFSAGRYAYLHRRTGGGSAWRPVWAKAELTDLKSRPDVARPGTEVIRVDLQPLKQGGVLERNFLLRDGDLLYVPRRQMEFAYLLGELKVPGAFELPNQRRITATQAVAWTGGPTRFADLKGALLVRQEANGERRELPLDLAAVFRGEQPDVEIGPNDIIYVPGNTGKKIGLNVLGVLQNLAIYVLMF